jgi:hypothetical protein
MESINPVTAIATAEAPVSVYPKYEELTFRAPVSSEEEALELLKSVQAIVNAVGGITIIRAVKAIERNPQILQQAMSILPLIMKG